MNGMESIVFMKVGMHASESFEDILVRKNKEFDRAGMSFWGYGGGTMHPISKLQPFAKFRVEQGRDVRLIMEVIKSNHSMSAVADEYSEDGENWKPIPDGIEVRGSKYAVVLNEIVPGDLEVDLTRYVVGIGPSEGKNAGGYIKGRIDKGLLDYVGPANEVVPRIVKSAYSAKLAQPFGVLLRGERPAR